MNNYSNLKVSKLIKQITIILMLIFFLILAFTGIIRLPETQKYFTFVYDYISASNLALVHDWSGIILVFFVIIHLILKRKWFSNLINQNEVLMKKSKVVNILLIFLVVGLIFINLLRSKSNEKAVTLEPVEIKEYQGEKLGSINDFRENSIKGIQYLNKNDYQLEFYDGVGGSTKFSYNDLLKLQPYQKVVQLNCVEGWSVKGLWKGFLVKDLIKNFKIDSKINTIIFYAADGYSTSFPLSYILNNNILLAYNLNGIELPPERGFPLQLVAEQKWGYKWIKWITKIELSDNVDYKGYWESRGYNNNGDLSGPKFQ